MPGNVICLCTPQLYRHLANRSDRFNRSRRRVARIRSRSRRGNKLHDCGRAELARKQVTNGENAIRIWKYRCRSTTAGTGARKPIVFVNSNTYYNMCHIHMLCTISLFSYICTAAIPLDIGYIRLFGASFLISGYNCIARVNKPEKYSHFYYLHNHSNISSRCYSHRYFQNK